jgi:hypothetical protein
VYSFAGFNATFTELLAQYPPALEEAQRAQPFIVGNLVFSLASLVYGLNAALGDSQLTGTEIGLTLGLVGGSLAMGLVADGHMRRSVDLFNSRSDSIPPPLRASRIPPRRF